MERLKSTLQRIDGKGYKAYKDISGKYDFGDFILYIDYVQGDPFASPSRIRVRVQQDKALLPKELWANNPRRIGLQDYLARQTVGQIKKYAKGMRGTGKSGLISIDAGGQEILERTALVLNQDFVEARFSLGLPARGRSVLGRAAIDMFTEELPNIIRNSLFYKNIPADEALTFVKLKEDQQQIRDEIVKRNLVCFIANGSILPRQSGISDRPMNGNVVPFESPSDLMVEIDLPNKGIIKGMGIPEGVTLIVGGGYHGKSTMLKAIERGVYDHIPGDGREYVITRHDAVKIRAEDGRRVEKVDITPFINNLPFGGSTKVFSSDDASGSTSQAANIVEALEVGTSVLLLDEDTSATNFMIRDARMQSLVAKDKEPITPFVDKVQQLYSDRGVSTILVMGGSGDYFDSADLVIMMDEYKARNITEKAKRIAQERPTERSPEGGKEFGLTKPRIPLKNSFQPQKGRKTKVDAKGLSTIIFGNSSIDLMFLEQLADNSQTRAIANFIYYISENHVNNNKSLLEVLESAFKEIREKGLDVISPYFGKHPGNFAMPRLQEVAGAINRLRTLNIK